MLNADALGDINTLYSIIFRMTFKSQASNWEFEKFCRIVGAIVVLHEPLCLEDLSALLDLRQTPTSAPVDVVNFVRRLRTVLVAGTGEIINSKTIPRLHKSFFEFITSQHVDPRFRIDSRDADGDIAVKCLLQFRNHGMTGGQPSSAGSLPGSLRYAFRFWSLHLREAAGTIPSIITQDTCSLTQTELHQLLQRSSNDERLHPLH
ncbi:hypothetical protein FPV67DRAFT_1696021 [Lyophyllum atratum]|nr:hypothetical protein FPV67DRAFT_1696021 [Lyophyllum atratum]